jgi:lambda repressor-like predicted transcriptional regulator
MHPADINAALLKAGANQTRIAEKHNVSCNAVSSVIHGRMKSRRLANAIAKVTGIPVNTLWPGKYTKRQSLKLAA